MNYLSVFSGVEAATVAWHPLGFTPIGFAEIDPFAAAVLAERFGSNLPGEPLARNGVPNHGDVTAIDLAAIGRVDLLVGGSPCQAFSFAGARKSLADARGNLTLAYAVLAHELARTHGLRNALWENVPGVLSTDDNAFGCFLGCLVGADSPLDLPRGIGRWPDEGMVEGPRARAAWRVLDAQYFGLAQRRERVFVVADFGSGADPAAVLFERKGVRGNPAPRRQARQDVAATVTASTGGCSGKDDIAGRVIAFGGGNCSGPIDVAATLTAKGQRIDFEVETFLATQVAHTIRAEGFDASEDGTGRGVPLIPVAFEARQSDVLVYGDLSGPMTTGCPGPSIAHGFAVRRLTPVECARLQGFPDHHSRIAWRGKPAAACPDGPQYKTYGNSMAVNVMRWLGERIAAEMPR